MLPGLGKAVISAILQVTYPTEYGVYNNVSSAGLLKIGMHPSVPGFDSLTTGSGDQVRKPRSQRTQREVRRQPMGARHHLGGLKTPVGPESSTAAPEVSAQVQEPSSGDVPSSRFRSEKQLEEFLVENWSETLLRPLSIFRPTRMATSTGSNIRLTLGLSISCARTRMGLAIQLSS